LHGNIKTTIELDACLICDYAGNDNFWKAGNWSKANVPCFFMRSSKIIGRTVAMLACYDIRN